MATFVADAPINGRFEIGGHSLEIRAHPGESFAVPDEIDGVFESAYALLIPGLKLVTGKPDVQTEGLNVVDEPADLLDATGSYPPPAPEPEAPSLVRDVEAELQAALARLKELGG